VRHFGNDGERDREGWEAKLGDIIVERGDLYKGKSRDGENSKADTGG